MTFTYAQHFCSQNTLEGAFESWQDQEVVEVQPVLGGFGIFGYTYGRDCMPSSTLTVRSGHDNHLRKFRMPCLPQSLANTLASHVFKYSKSRRDSAQG